MNRGCIYREKHLRKKNDDGTEQRRLMWTAEVWINDIKYRKKSLKRERCEEWLRLVNLYLEGKGEFPARQTHPGEDPLKVFPDKDGRRTSAVSLQKQGGEYPGGTAGDKKISSTEAEL